MLHPRLGEQRMLRGRFRHCNPFIPPKGNSRPISNLPIELLSRIFQFGAENEQGGDANDPVTTHVSDESYQVELDSEADDSVEGETGDVGLADDNGVGRVIQSSNAAHIPHPFQLIVSHVNQLWRTTAISTAFLWTNITITPSWCPPYRHVSVFLERSQGLPINICVYFGSQEHDTPSTSHSAPSIPDIEQLYSLLVAHVHRWRSVEVKAVSSEHMYTFISAVSAPAIAAPQLTSLALSVNRAKDEAHAFWPLITAASATMFSGGAPYLESLHLERIIIHWNQDWVAGASRLTTLGLHKHHLTAFELDMHPDDFCPSWDEFTAILRGAPALECLILNGSGPSRDPPSIDPNSNVLPNTLTQLPRLTHLALLCQPRNSVYALIRMLYMPVLKSFAIDCFWDDYSEFLSHVTSPVFNPVAISTEERSPSLLRGLEAFDINCLSCKPDFVEPIYDELENTKSLTISMDDSWYGTSGCTLILPLLPPKATIPVDGAVSPRLPRLEALFVSNISTQFQFGVIRYIVQQRSDIGFPIKSLNIVATCDMERADRAWFEESLERFVFSKTPAKRFSACAEV